MQFKGGLINGTLASVYGAVSMWCLFFSKSQHHSMKTTCYVLAALGVLLALYWLATKEAYGIPILLVGLTHIGLGARAEHDAMNVGCTGLAVVAFVTALLMLGAVRQPSGSQG